MADPIFDPAYWSKLLRHWDTLSSSAVRLAVWMAFHPKPRRVADLAGAAQLSKPTTIAALRQLRSIGLPGKNFLPQPGKKLSPRSPQPADVIKETLFSFNTEEQQLWELLDTLAGKVLGDPRSHPNLVPNLRAAAGAASLSDIIALLQQRHAQGYRAGTGRGPRDWGWYVAVVRNHFQPAVRPPRRRGPGQIQAAELYDLIERRTKGK
jgi:hypothetical protein